jgi:hypothetical protein
MSDRARQILGFALAIVVAAAFFVLVLGVGFALNPPDNMGFTNEILPASATLLASLAGLVLVLRSFRGAVPPPFRRAVPRRRGPRTMPSEAQLAYARDVTRLATCPHLEVIERDIRRQGVPVRLRYGNVVIADCHIDEPLLRQRYAIAPPVYYLPNMPGDRYGEPETAVFSCREHSSVIETVPPSEAGPTTMIFPTG